MTCTVHHIRGDRQTGKTTMALGFLERLERTATARQFVARGLYVAYSQRNAQHWRGLTPILCTGFDTLRRDDLPGRAAVVFDDCEFLPRGSFEQVLMAWNHLIALDCPTQLVLVNWPGEFPPKEFP